MSVNTFKGLIQEQFPELELYTARGNIFIKGGGDYDYIKQKLLPYKTVAPEFLLTTKYKKETYPTLDFYTLDNSRIFLLKRGVDGCYFHELL